MKKYLLVLFVVFSMSLALAIDFQAATVTNPVTQEPKNTITIPSKAVEVAPNLFYLGTAQDVNGKIVEGFLFVDNRRENAKPPGAGQGKNSGNCYAFLAKGAKWKTTEQYITGDGIDPLVTETSLNTWDQEVLFDVFGTRDITMITDGADSITPDGKNEVEFANLGETSTIAYTIVWGIFYGPPNQRELVEWDAVFNTAYPFGNADNNSAVMDYQNIATHEFGHALGLGHPQDSCTEETMYRFAAYGETKKRTLEIGDITGIKQLYK